MVEKRRKSKVLLKRIKKANSGEKSDRDFVYLFVHQIKKPLSSIRISLQMILHNDFGILNKEQESILRKLLQQDETLFSYETS